MTQEHEIQAVRDLGRQFQLAVRRLPLTPAPPRRRLRRVLVIGVAGLGVAVPAVAAATGAFDFGDDVVRAGQPGGPPAPRTAPSGPDVRTVDVLALAEGDRGIAALRAAVAPYGLRVATDEQPVAGSTVGRVLDVEYPRDAQLDARRRLLLERGDGGTIRVTIGVPATAPAAADMTLLEALPDVRRAVDRADPVETGRRLAALGYAVTWRLVVDNPARDGVAVPATGSKPVDAPPTGSRILSVLNADGENRATKDTRALLVELAAAGAQQAHP